LVVIAKIISAFTCLLFTFLCYLFKNFEGLDLMALPIWIHAVWFVIVRHNCAMYEEKH